MLEQIINVDRMEQAVSLFGSFDENVRLIEQHYGVDIVSRGSDLKVSGEGEGVAKAVRAIEGLLQLINRGEQLNEQNVRYVLTLVDEGSDQELPQLSGDSICITSKGRPVKPKTLGQKRYIEAIRSNTVVLGIGPAGTGKTYLAVAMAVKAFRAKEVNRIILTRPAVEAGEKLGFLPGDLQSKVDPYLRPLYDALFDMLGTETYQKYLERGNIEVAPLAYMRADAGRQLHHSGRGAEHHARTDENVPHPPGFQFQDGCYRRHYADRSSGWSQERPARGHARSQGCRGHRHLPI